MTLCARGDVYGFGVWVVWVFFGFSAKQNVCKRLLIFEGRVKQ